MTESVTNREHNRNIGIESVSDVIKRPWALLDEVVINRPHFEVKGVPEKHVHYRPCPVCISGFIPFDSRKRNATQFQQCMNCNCVFEVHISWGGNVKYRYRKDIEPDWRKRWF